MKTDKNLQDQFLIEYEQHMSKAGSFGTIFELNIAAMHFGFTGMVFMKQDNIFQCINIGYSDNENDKFKPKIFIVFTGPRNSGHFRLLKPNTVISMKFARNIPCGEYSILNDDGNGLLIMKINPNTSKIPELDSHSDTEKKK